MSISIVILLTLLSQIWFLSFFYPKKIIARLDFVLKHCPEKDYPKLYPVSADRIKTIRDIYQYANHFLIVVGLALLAYFIFIVPDFKRHLNILDDIPLLFGMAQFFPLFILELLGFKHLKLMRENNTATSRKAVLLPRRLFNFISPLQLCFAIFIYIAFVLFELFIHDFVLTFDASIKLATVSLVNILFIGLGMANLFGKKRDPYQDNNERNKQTKFVLQSLLFISIFMSIYLMAHSLVNIYELNYVEVMINSLYFQVIALFSVGALIGRLNVEKMNFDVYKKTTDAQ